MAENAPDNAAAGEENPTDSYFGIGKIYLQDVSFESPNAAELFVSQADWDPKIEVTVNIDNKKLSSEEFETSLKITVTATHQDKIAYITEVVQSGIFSARGFEEQDFNALRYSYCPNILYPYASQVIADLTVKGGFPAYTVEPINFEALHEQNREKLKKQREAQAAKK